MVNFTVEKLVRIDMDDYQKYKFIYTKTLKDVNGVEFVVADEGRIISQSKDEIISQIAIYQNVIDECKSKLAEITKLEEV